MTQTPGAPWIRAKDYAETTIWFSATNSTTNTPITQKAQAELTEVSSKGMTLKLPNNSCAVGHMLLLSIHKEKKVLNKNAKTEIKGAGVIPLTAKVIEVEPLNESAKIVTLQFYQYDEEIWKSFIKEFAERQEAVNQIVRDIKD
ncbi:hypothetical protein WDW37_18320 [Bdellovibrionota bacterium FG-1]